LVQALVCCVAIHALTATLDKHHAGQQTSDDSVDAGLDAAGAASMTVTAAAAAAAASEAVGVTCGLAVPLVVPYVEPLRLAWPVVDVCREEDSTPAATAADG
jgi:hypothetical protein